MNTSKKTASAAAQDFPSVRCPKCGWRLCDRLGRTEGELSFKCTHCHRIVKVDIHYRKAAKGLAGRIAAWF